MMRTTLNLDEDILRAAKSLARERGTSVGDVISALVRDALRPPGGIRYEAEFPVFEVGENAPPITPEMVESALEES
jgi:hypothetical protein